MSLSSAQSSDTTSRRRRQAEHTDRDVSGEPDPAAGHNHEQIHDRQRGGPQPNLTGTPSSHHLVCPALCTTKCMSTHRCPSHHVCDDSWVEIQSKRTIRAENEVEANKLVNNYRFGFRKWKSHVTARPFEDRSEVVKELYSELNVIKPQSGRLITCGNVAYVFLFGWWISLVYVLVGILMFISITGIPYGKLCWKLSCYFLWPFGKSIHKIGNTLRTCCERAPDCDCNIQGTEDNSPVLLPSPTEVPIPELPDRTLRTPYWVTFNT